MTIKTQQERPAQAPWTWLLVGTFQLVRRAGVHHSNTETTTTTATTGYHGRVEFVLELRECNPAGFVEKFKVPKGQVHSLPVARALAIVSVPTVGLRFSCLHRHHTSPHTAAVTQPAARVDPSPVESSPYLRSKTVGICSNWMRSFASLAASLSFQVLIKISSTPGGRPNIFSQAASVLPCRVVVPVTTITSTTGPPERVARIRRMKVKF